MPTCLFLCGLVHVHLWQPIFVSGTCSATEWWRPYAWRLRIGKARVYISVQCFPVCFHSSPPEKVWKYEACHATKTSSHFAILHYSQKFPTHTHAQCQLTLSCIQHVEHVHECPSSASLTQTGTCLLLLLCLWCTQMGCQATVSYPLA